MKHLTTSYAFTVFALCIGSLFMMVDDYQRALLLDKLSLYFVIFYLLVIHWCKIPYSQLFSKIRWLFPIIWVVSAIAFNLYLKWSPDSSVCDIAVEWGVTGSKAAAFRDNAWVGLMWVMYKPVLVGALFWKTYNLERRYRMVSDPIIGDHVYICLWRPHTSKTLIQSLSGVAVGSMCIYVHGKLYGFRWGHPKYNSIQVPRDVIRRKFIVIDTGIKPSNNVQLELNRLVGEPAGYCRCRCVYVIRRVLGEIHPDLTPRWYEYLPARYGIKLLKWRRSHG